MDTKQIEYILKIAEENNITKAADKLFITQSALNQQLLKLESELGTPLFHRSRTNWRPTAAGEIYIRNAREILRLKKNTYNQINDIANTKRGNLSIGFTPGRGINMFTSIYPVFHQKYPDVTVEPVEKSVHELQQMLADSSLDIAFLTLRQEDHTNDEYITLVTEEILLAVPAGHPVGIFAAPPGQPLSVIDLRKLQYEPFVVMDKNSTMRALANDIFKQYEISPNILFETRNNNTIIYMVQTNLCCGLVPSYYAQNQPENIAFFRLPSHPYWQVTASYKRNAYLSKPARLFIEMVKEHWNLNPFDRPSRIQPMDNPSPILE